MVPESLNLALIIRAGSAAGLSAAAMRGSMGARQQGSTGGQQREPPAVALYFTQQPPGLEAQTFPVSLPTLVRTGFDKSPSCIEGVQHYRFCPKGLPCQGRHT